MERRYTLNKKTAALLINRVQDENLPITIHEGNERIEANGDRLVDVLLDNATVKGNVVIPAGANSVFFVFNFIRHNNQVIYLLKYLYYSFS